MLGRFPALLKTLNCELCESTDDETVKPNFCKSNLERDVDEITRRIGDYNAMLLERSQQARQLKMLPS
jgi:hypothetical protein